MTIEISPFCDGDRAAVEDVCIDKCHLLVFRDNRAGQAFWRAIGAEERVSLTLFSLMTEPPEP
jgi:hypothetical protein